MGDDQQLCLKWNNHQSTLIDGFDTLLENEKLVDCTLAAEGRFLNAHKVVLAACSPYFEALLSQHYDKRPILILKDVKFQELKAMMDYMYRGEANISQDQLGALLKTAESLQIKGLSDNKKEEPAKRAVPVPSASIRPPPQLPKVQGLTIRLGSTSHNPRKKKRIRCESEDLNNHHDASNSSGAHSLHHNIPSANSLPINEMNSDVTIETKQEIMIRHKDDNGSHQQSQVPMIKEKIESHTELMLELKSEYVEEINEDSIEDLSTLDDDDLGNMEQRDGGAGPSHGEEGSLQQGFGHWQSQDEIFLAAQEAVSSKVLSRSRPQIICDRCYKVYKNPKCLTAHKAQDCGRSKTFTCTYCDKDFRTKGQLKVHMRNQHGEMTFEEIFNKVTLQNLVNVKSETEHNLSSETNPVGSIKGRTRKQLKSH